VVNGKKLRRLMREHDLQPKQRRRYVVTTDSDHAGPIYADLAKDSACSVSPAMNSPATWRLNAALCDRCFVMTSILRKPSKGGQFKSSNLSTRGGALQLPGNYSTLIDIPIRPSTPPRISGFSLGGDLIGALLHAATPRGSGFGADKQAATHFHDHRALAGFQQAVERASREAMRLAELIDCVSAGLCDCGLCRHVRLRRGWTSANCRCSRGKF
jgi:hypothetical protein